MYFLTVTFKFYFNMAYYAVLSIHDSDFHYGKPISMKK